MYMSLHVDVYVQNVCQSHQLSRLGAPLGFAAAYGKLEQTCKAHGKTRINPKKEDNCCPAMCDDHKQEIQNPSLDLCIILSLPVSLFPCL